MPKKVGNLDLKNNKNQYKPHIARYGSVNHRSVMYLFGLFVFSSSLHPFLYSSSPAAFFVAFLNVFWGTGCHVNNLIRLRHVTGMSGVALFLNLCGSVLHACLWLAVLICYLGFLDGADKEDFDKEEKKTKPAEVAVDV